MSTSEEYVSEGDHGDGNKNISCSSERNDKFVTLRKKHRMSRQAEQDALALRAELDEKVAEIERLQQRLTIATRATASPQDRIAIRRPDFRELRELVSRFNPKEATCLSAQEWIQEIESTAAHYDWDDATKLHCARLNLEGSSKLWWAGVQNEVNTWALFSQKLVRAYPSARDPIYYHNQMTKRRKMRDETVEEYVYSQVALGKRAGLSEAVIVKYTIAGLGEFVSKCRVQLGGKIETIDELISQLKWMEGMVNAARSYEAMVPICNCSHEDDEVDGELTDSEDV
ncbi:AAEL003702-PA [Aedes aegypti]|uniref:AAEL003702-PA n=1 Tax=Aedes aegypti TaxID=7159 RepID=Q17EV0_AEDAE|nr:AAEL003702-PA [Aedes aegypti]